MTQDSDSVTGSLLRLNKKLARNNRQIWKEQLGLLVNIFLEVLKGHWHLKSKKLCSICICFEKHKLLSINTNSKESKGKFYILNTWMQNTLYWLDRVICLCYENNKLSNILRNILMINLSIFRDQIII